MHFCQNLINMFLKSLIILWSHYIDSIARKLDITISGFSYSRNLWQRCNSIFVRILNQWGCVWHACTIIIYCIGVTTPIYKHLLIHNIAPVFFPLLQRYPIVNLVWWSIYFCQVCMWCVTNINQHFCVNCSSEKKKYDSISIQLVCYRLIYCWPL